MVKLGIVLLTKNKLSARAFERVKAAHNNVYEIDPSSGGKAMFAVNDFPMEQCFDDVTPDMFPVVHIQKKGVRIKASFGKKKTSNQVTKDQTPSSTSTTSKPGILLSPNPNSNFNILGLQFIELFHMKSVTFSVPKKVGSC